MEQEKQVVLDAIKYEHEALRNEVLHREGLHNTLLTWASALLIGLGGLGFTFWKDPPSVPAITFFILVPVWGMLIFLAVNIYSAQTERAGDYLFWLEKKFNALIGENTVGFTESTQILAKDFASKYGHDLIQPLMAPLGWEHWLRSLRIKKKSTHFAGLYVQKKWWHLAFVPLIFSFLGFFFWGLSEKPVPVISEVAGWCGGLYASLILVAVYLVIGVIYRVIATRIVETVLGRRLRPLRSEVPSLKEPRSEAESSKGAEQPGQPSPNNGGRIKE